MAPALPPYPCSLHTFSETEGFGTLHLSRWQQHVSVSAGGTAKARAAELTAGLQGAGARASVTSADEWRFETEADARRGFEWMVTQWPLLNQVKVTVANPELPEACEFWFSLGRPTTGATEEVRLSPALEYHRDEQRALVPRAEAWLEGVLTNPEYESKPEWTAQWRLTREGMQRLLRGPLDPFVG